MLQHSVLVSRGFHAGFQRYNLVLQEHAKEREITNHTPLKEYHPRCSISKENKKKTEIL